MGSSAESRQGERALIEAARRTEFGRNLNGDLRSSTAFRGRLDPDGALEFGEYQVVREVHRGGQGVVYEAVQGSTRRRVAIKVLHLGPLAGPRDRVRFEREIRVLGQLDHPHIVKILHTGRAHGGIYFVMEFIDGAPIDAFVEAGRMSVRATMTLIGQICRAVQAAHVRGVIHRDLKPSNILVNTLGSPRILDFGLAKLAEEARDMTITQSIATQSGQFMGSLPWASPEQVEGWPDGVDFRTDVYSIGVIAYRLLTGRMPRPTPRNVREAYQSIVERDVVRPSTHRPEIEPDVDAIVLKCLRRERHHRYQTTDSIAQEIDRYLNHVPVHARAPGAAEAVIKFVRRHRIGVSVVVGLFVLAAGISVWTGRLYARASRELQVSRTMLDFLTGDMIAAAKPEVAQGEELTVRQQLESAAAHVDQAFPDNPVIRGRLQMFIGEAYKSLGDATQAKRFLSSALSLLESNLGATNRDVMRIRLDLVDLAYAQGRGAAMEQASIDLIQQCTDWFGPDDPLTLEATYQLANIAWFAGDRVRSSELHRKVYRVRRATLGAEHADTLSSKIQLAKCQYMFDSNHVGAERSLRAVIDQGTAALGESHPLTLLAKANLASALAHQRRLTEANNLYDTTIRDLRRVCGDLHPTTISAVMTRADTVYMPLGFNQSAARDLRALRVLLKKEADLDNPLGGELDQFLAIALLSSGDWIGSIETSRDLLDRQVARHGEPHHLTASAMGGLGVAYMLIGEDQEAEDLFRKMYEINLELLGADHRSTMWAVRLYLRALARRGDEDLARQPAEQLIRFWQGVTESPDTDAYMLTSFARELLDVYPADLRDPERSVQLAERAFDMVGDEYHFNRFTLGRAYERVGDYDRAVAMYRRAIAHSAVEVSNESRQYHATLSALLASRGDDAGALQVYRDVLLRRQEAMEPDDPSLAFAFLDLAAALNESGQFEEALSDLREARRVARVALQDAHHLHAAIGVERSRSLLGLGRPQDSADELRLVLNDMKGREIPLPGLERQARSLLREDSLAAERDMAR